MQRAALQHAARMEEQEKQKKNEAIHQKNLQKSQDSLKDWARIQRLSPKDLPVIKQVEWISPVDAALAAIAHSRASLQSAS